MTLHVGTANLRITGARAYWNQGCLNIAFSQNILIKTSYSLEMYRWNISAGDVDYFCLHIYDADDETLRLHRDRRFVRARGPEIYFYSKRPCDSHKILIKKERNLLTVQTHRKYTNYQRYIVWRP